MGIVVTQKGNFKKTEKFLKKTIGHNYQKILERYGKMGVDALSAATPIDTGETAASWYYKIEKRNNGVSLVWKNSNVQSYVNIAVILQYGHGTRNGGYVDGRDYINPALRPIFDAFAKAAWKEVTEQ